jgi:hypothetical protein
MTNFEKIYQKCKEAGFDEYLTAEMCWNEAYRLGRSRWYWGPIWWVKFLGQRPEKRVLCKR